MIHLIKKLPDIPRWIYARSLLLSDRGKVYSERENEFDSFIVTNPETRIVCVVGKPPEKLIEQAILEAGEGSSILSTPDNETYIGQTLSNWERSPALLHTLQDASHYQNFTDDAVGFITIDELSNYSHIPAGLFGELEIASKYSPLAVLLIEGVPVSFCYAAAETETLWDISIDTLDEFRKHGYAARCISFMIRHMLKEGKMPVWGSEISNIPSLRLATKLGFTHVDELFLFRKIETDEDIFSDELFI